jgi:hypothetical protein
MKNYYDNKIQNNNYSQLTCTHHQKVTTQNMFIILKKEQQ